VLLRGDHAERRGRAYFVDNVAADNAAGMQFAGAIVEQKPVDKPFGQGFGIGRVLVSPLGRARETASILFGDAPLEIRPELREIDFGAFELLEAAEIEVSFPGELERRRASPVDYRPPGGESFRDVARRLRALHDELRLASSVAVVAHRGTLGVLERLLCGVPLDDRSVTPLEPATFRCWFASSRPN